MTGSFTAYIKSSLLISSVFFLMFTLVIRFAGVRLTRLADKLADITGIGEALFGAVLLGGITSIAGIIASVTAAYNGYGQLAVSNAIGGIAAQTTFLAIADISYRKANLEHASASLQNIMMGALLIGQLILIVMVASTPGIEFTGFHPASILFIVIYIAGIYLISKAKKSKMWTPRKTSQTVIDKKHFADLPKGEQAKLWLEFILFSIIVGCSGFIVAHSGIGIAENSGLSETFVGALFTAISTSLPELVVSIAAVKQGSLNLAVGNIIGGNTFDVLFVAFADFAFLQGSIYHVLSSPQIFLIGLTILMTTVLIIGLLFRQKYGPGKIGWESVLILALFIFGYLLML